MPNCCQSTNLSRRQFMNVRFRSFTTRTELNAARPGSITKSMKAVLKDATHRTSRDYVRYSRAVSASPATHNNVGVLINVFFFFLNDITFRVRMSLQFCR